MKNKWIRRILKEKPCGDKKTAGTDPSGGRLADDRMTRWPVDCSCCWRFSFRAERHLCEQSTGQQTNGTSDRGGRIIVSDVPVVSQVPETAWLGKPTSLTGLSPRSRERARCPFSQRRCVQGSCGELWGLSPRSCERARCPFSQRRCVQDVLMRLLRNMFSLAFRWGWACTNAADMA